jgi:hypothetical protein
MHWVFYFSYHSFQFQNFYLVLFNIFYDFANTSYFFLKFSIFFRSVLNCYLKYFRWWFL